MGYSEDRSKKWRLLNQLWIQQWREALKTRLSWGGYFSEERLEMEVLQLLEDPEMKEIWRYACRYVARRKPAKLKSMFITAKKEIERFGTIEPFWRQELTEIVKKATRGTRKI